MVSFECDACNETIKKPKLLNHWNSCRAKVVCLDCSTEFYTPDDFKSHTSCVSEAEKYQKGLYKGPKANGRQNGDQLNNSNNNASQAAATGKYQSWSKNTNGYAGGGPQRQHQSRGGGYNNSYVKPCGTGANDTPLGTPARMSPVNASPTAQGVAKQQSATSGAADVKTMDSGTGGVKVKEKKEKRNKKRKAEQQAASTTDEPMKKKFKTIAEDVPAPSTSLPEKSKKKAKKEKREKKAQTIINTPDPSEKVEVKENQHKKSESEKVPVAYGENQVVEAAVTSKPKISKEEEDTAAAEPAIVAGRDKDEVTFIGEEKQKKKKKSKKSKGESMVETDTVVIKAPAAKADEESKPKKEKRHKKIKSKAVEAS